MKTEPSITIKFTGMKLKKINSLRNQLGWDYETCAGWLIEAGQVMLDDHSDQAMGELDLDWLRGSLSTDDPQDVEILEVDYRIPLRTIVQGYCAQADNRDLLLTGTLVKYSSGSIDEYVHVALTPASLRALAARGLRNDPIYLFLSDEIKEV